MSSKVSALGAISDINDTDLFYVIDGSLGSVGSKKITVGDVRTTILGDIENRYLPITGVYYDRQAGTREFTLSYNVGTRTLTITPTGTSFRAWIFGTEYTFSGTQTIVHSTAIGQHFIYVNTSGTLTVSTSAWDILKHAPIARITYTGTEGWVVPEWHSAYRDAEYHRWAHLTQGTQALSGGFALSGYTLNVATDVATSPGVSGGTLKDEDVDATIQAQPAGAAYQRWYNNGATWLRSTASVPFYYGTYVQYVNAGTLTDLTNNDTTIVWHACAPAQDTTYQHYFIAHTSKYSSVAEAEAASFAYSDFGWLIDQEGVVLWKLIYQANAGDANTGKCRLMAVQQMSRSRNSTVAGASTSLAYTAISGVPQNTVLGRSSAGTGYAESISCLAGGRALLGTVTALTAGYVPLASTGGALTDSVLRQNSSKIGIGIDPTGIEALQVSGAIYATGTIQGSSMQAGATAITSGYIEINANASGDRNALLDLHSDDTYADFGLRLARFAGANGTASLHHRGTGTLYLYAQEAASIEFHTASSVRMRIAADGKIGIGIDPTGTEALQVSGAISATTGLKMLQSAGGDFTGGSWSRDTNWGTYYRSPYRGAIADFALADSDGTVVLYVGDARIGIGRAPTTYALEVAGVSSNHVTGTGAVTTAVLSHSSTSIGDGCALLFAHSVTERTGRIYSYATSTNAGRLVIGSANPTSGYYDELCLVGGKVGIGRTPTTYALEVEGAVLVNQSTSASTLVVSGTVEAQVLAASAISRVEIGAKSNHPLRLNTNNTPAIYIGTDQKVGIGGAASAEKLEVTGNVFASGNLQAGTYVYAGMYVACDYLRIQDAVTEPSTVSGEAIIYVDSADGDLKVKFGDGTVKTIVTDT
jgi:hypothetical protein